MSGSETAGFRDAYWNPDAGWCNASGATSAVLGSALRQGVRYVSALISHVVLENDGAAIRTADGQMLAADQIVMASGAWTSSLMTAVEDELGLTNENRIESQVTATGVCVAHYQMNPTEMESLSEMPVVVYGTYGEVIPPPEQSKLLKYTNARTVANTATDSTGRKISRPLLTDQHEVPYKYWRLCWDAISPTQDWTLDRHPDSRLSNLYFAIGGSFHSYKFLPNAGLYMANILMGISNGYEEDEHWAWKKGQLDLGQRSC